MTPLSAIDDRLRAKWWIVEKLVRVHRRAFPRVDRDDAESLAAWALWDREAHDTCGATWPGCARLYRWRLLDLADAERLRRPDPVGPLPDDLTSDAAARRVDARRQACPGCGDYDVGLRKPPRRVNGRCPPCAKAEARRLRKEAEPCVACGDPAGWKKKKALKAYRCRGLCKRCEARAEAVDSRRPAVIRRT